MTADPDSEHEPLDAWHRQHGAQWRDTDGCLIVAAYGEVTSEHAALRRASGLIERRWVEELVVAGEDRRRFLNGYLTCDVASLEPGSGTYGFFTSAQGRILADAVVTADAETLRLEVPRGRRAVLIEHLSRYILADRVELRPEEGLSRWLLVGPTAEASVARLEAVAPQTPWSTVETAFDGSALTIRRERALGLPALSLSIEAAAATSLADELLALDTVPVGFDALESLRLEAGVPRYGADFDEAHFPQETGLDDAVSYTKGCYLGQEVVARIHYRGRVNHKLRSLAVSGDVTPALGIVEFEGEEVGRLGSVAFLPTVGHAVGLTILHRKAAATGTLVSLPGGVEARVEEPGFAAQKSAPSTA